MNNTKRQSNGKDCTEKTSEVVSQVLVVGGGIAGIQSALDLANAGFKVYLVEKKPSIGGVMAQLDKTFPTNDCSMCILSPKLVEAGRHPNIEILTCSNVEQVTGQAGHFTVTVRKHARYVDIEKCTSCGDCRDVCPVTRPNEFEEKLSDRHAIYQMFPQANPSAYMIDKNGASPCRLACPAGLNAHAFIALASQEKYAEAYELIKETIPLPGSLGRICYHPCESECNRKDIDETISICLIRRYIADYIYEHPEALAEYQKTKTEKQQGKESIETKRGNGQKVAIIGAGPTGLTAAYDLSKKGYKPVIFEAEKYSGGMLHYGVPDYRLPKDYLHKEVDPLCEQQQIEMKNNQKLGRDFTIADLKKQGFKAVLLAIGAHKTRAAGIECCTGTDTCVLEGVEYLKQLNRNMIAPEFFKGKTILVIGGGNVAMDSARTARRLGGNVTIVYRRTLKEMPAYKEEIHHAQEEGIEFIFLTAPIKLQKKEKETCLECIRMELAEPDSSGRRRPQPLPNSEFDIPCDYSIFAIGQELDTKLMEDNAINLTPDGFIQVDAVSLQTSQDGVFAGGDAVTGPASAVEAIAAGHEAAISIERYLNNEDLKKNREKQPQQKVKIPPETSCIPMPREHPLVLCTEERIKSFAEVNQGFSTEQLLREAKRCINCAGCCECLQCIQICEPEAINHTMKDETIRLDVGSIILSPGFDEFKPEIKQEYGYGRFPNVLTSIEFERVLSASGPSAGHVVRPSDQKEPRKIAWIQCVGSRDIPLSKNYCSSVCCTYAIKEAVIAKEHAPDIQPTIFYMDMRTYGKGFESYYNRAEKEYGVRFIRCRISSVEEDKKTRNLSLKYETEDGTLKQEDFDLVVLSVGLSSPVDSEALSTVFGININKYNYALTTSFEPFHTTKPGIYVAGAFAGPKDIPETVAQASGAAALASALLSQSRGKYVTVKRYPPPRDVHYLTPRVGVFICHCGSNIGGFLDVASLTEYTKTLPFVVYVENNLFTCSQDTQTHIKDIIKEHDINRVVVASCTPRTHEPLFQDTMKEAGLNQYLFEMANIRDQCSWVHMKEPQKATEKAKDLLRMAISKAALLKPLPMVTLPVNQNALVLGGGLTGLTAAIMLAEQGFPVFLVEKEKELGGNLRQMYSTLTGDNVQHILQDLIKKIKENKRIQVFTDTHIDTLTGYIGNFTTIVKEKDETKELHHGIVIVATGAQQYTPSEYLYGSDKRVLTQREFEHQLEKKEGALTKGEPIVMIQCVGSRDENHPYCSRICCTQAMKNVLHYLELNKDATVYVLYQDIRTYGFKEEYYQKARERGVIFIHYYPGRKPVVENIDGALTIRVFDAILGEDLSIHADRLVLSTGIVPPSDNLFLSKMLKVPLNEDGFFLEAHTKLRPVDFATDGVFLAGLAHSPMCIEESIAQALAAVSRACTILSKEFLELPGTIAQVNEQRCVGCGLCEQVCVYKAIEMVKKTKDGKEQLIAKVNEGLCKGCGVCAGACFSGAITHNSFKDEQILAMIKSIESC
jgi:heterodisulfide reductase subunit A-like polyferredoxin